jgi:thiamine-monophosphate kinase
MKVSELGEFGLIELLARTVGKPRDDSVLIGIGDDAACWRASAGLALATTDTLVENVHFSLGYATWREVGWKSVAVNLSDIAAMGGVPRHALVTLGLPKDTDVANVSKLYKGMAEMANTFDVDIVGGDVVAAPQVVISLTILGETIKNRKALTRSAAAPGDEIMVTGSLGASAAGLAMLNRELEFNYHIAKTLREAHLKPMPRVVEGQMLARHGVKAAIDLSDGLVGDLDKLCIASGVGARIYIEQVPVHETVVQSFGVAGLTLALAGGEDYELLFTASSDISDRVKSDLPCPVTAIGEIVPEAGVKLLDEGGIELQLGDAGWDHFSKRKR